ncbi:hypothetical protein V7H95_03270 [Serratia marcescens]|uniref:hypothetical protein n=1 Tax=Serratia marcescens TaxID=615 RepID=UPI0013DB8B41|nr:hypothetical protein [Serratia marcescens]EIV2912223.1 hypothetical protein [Serratia marcescens]WPJ25886.1 hypothetical protein NAE95_10245 [Serratia marcescens]
MPQNKRNIVSLLLNRHAVVIMLGGRESDGPRRVVTATQRGSRPPLPPATPSHRLFSHLHASPIARFLFSPVKIDDLLRSTVTSRCKTGKNKQLVTG